MPGSMTVVSFHVYSGGPSYNNYSGLIASTELFACVSNLISVRIEASISNTIIQKHLFPIEALHQRVALALTWIKFPLSAQ